VRNARGRHTLEGNFDAEYVFDDRGRKQIAPKTGAARTLHFFGDSLVFGHGVSNKDTALNLLSDRLGGAFNVMNYGVMGYGVEQIFLRFHQNEEEIHRGDYVVFIPSSLDVFRDIGHPKYICTVHFRALQPVASYPRFMSGEWQFVSLIDECGYVTDYLLMTSRLPFGFLWRMLRGVYERFMVTPRTWEDVRALLAEAEGRAKARGAGFRMVLFTTPQECEQGYHNVDWRAVGRPVDSLLAYCPADRAEIEDLGFPGDGHLSIAGNRWAAAALERWLIDREIVPGRLAAVE
jgi:hypothetical protein